MANFFMSKRPHWGTYTVRRTVALLGILLDSLFSNCPQTVLQQVRQGQAQSQWHIKPSHFQDSTSLRNWIQSRFPTWKLAQESPSTQALLRLTSMRHNQSHFATVSIWEKSYTLDGKETWSPCWDTWIWSDASASDFKQDWNTLIQQLQNHLILEIRNETPSSKDCPMPGYCPATFRPSLPKPSHP